MASQTRQAREAERKLSVRTLAIASVSSAVAAVVVSQFWKGGTAPAAAVTPVIVSLVSELLRKPTEAISARVTTDRTAVLPEAAGAGAPTARTMVATGAPARDSEGPRPASEERPPPLRATGEEPVPSDKREVRGTPVTYHRAGADGRHGGGGRRFPVRLVAATAALAILIGAAILTVPELIAGDSLGKRGGTTLFGGGKSSSDNTQGGESQGGAQQPDRSPPPDQQQPESDRQDTPTQQPNRQQPPRGETKTPAPEQTKPQSTPAPQPQPKPPPSQP
ncbi:MAG: hypothetical protein M3350_10705 [Actinomycetota bacterium]|nr:hypothetical protein [Actinomycetota bacterium]MDQ3721230.1 hypothetical protein [Actinomycetota bacterium]